MKNLVVLFLVFALAMSAFSGIAEASANHDQIVYWVGVGDLWAHEQAEAAYLEGGLAAYCGTYGNWMINLSNMGPWYYPSESIYRLCRDNYWGTIFAEPGDAEDCELQVITKFQIGWFAGNCQSSDGVYASGHNWVNINGN